MSETAKPVTLEELQEIVRNMGRRNERMQELNEKSLRESRQERLEGERSLREALRESLKESKQERLEGERSLRQAQEENKRSQQEVKQALKELAAEHEKTEKALKKTDASFNTKWGKLIESLVEGDLVKILNKKNIKVEQTTRNIEASFEKQRYEFDILAMNGSETVVVEVKTTLRVSDVDYFLEKLSVFKKMLPKFTGDKLYGAMAYLKADEGSAQYSEKKGLFVIRATGSSASIINQEDFKPKVF